MFCVNLESVISLFTLESGTSARTIKFTAFEERASTCLTLTNTTVVNSKTSTKQSFLFSAKMNIKNISKITVFY